VIAAVYSGVKHAIKHHPLKTGTVNLPLIYNRALRALFLLIILKCHLGKMQEYSMKKCGVFISLLVVIASLLFVLSACGSRAELGQEFSISVGQTVTITDEDMEITFKEVMKDNRCPGDVVCITAGEVVCLIQITEGESAYNIELAQPGLYYGYSQESFGGYKYNFKVEPYPESDKTISTGEYSVLLTVNK